MRTSTLLTLFTATSLLLATSLLAVEKEPLTLELTDAIEMALTHNRDLIQSRFAVTSRAYGVSGALAEFAYSLRPTGRAGSTDGAADVLAGLALSRKLSWGTGIELRGIYSDTEDIEDENFHRGSVRLQVTQPLFRNFGTLVQREGVVRAEWDLVAAERSYELFKADLIVQVAASYEEILRLEKQIESDNRFFVRVDTLFRLTTAREKQGRASRIDTLRVDLQRGQAESRLVNNNESLHRVRQDFADLLGLPPLTPINLLPSPRLDIEVPVESEALAVAFSNRLDFAQAQQDVADAQRQVAIARKNLQPQLAFVARAEQFGEGERRSDAADFNEQVWSVALASDTDLVTKRERATLNQRVVDDESARLVLDATVNRIQREVSQELLGYHRAQSDHDIAEKNARLASQRVRLARRLFSAGKGDNFTVTDAEDAWLDAEQRRHEATADASISGYRLMRALGTLVETPDKLKPGPVRNQ